MTYLTAEDAKDAEERSQEGHVRLQRVSTA